MAAASGVRAMILALVAGEGIAAPSSWIQAGAGDQKMCAGILDTCNSVQTCTYHAYGPCGGLSAPPVYIEGSLTELALISGGSEAYLSNNTLVSSLTPSSIPNNGYSFSDDNATVTDAAGAVTATYANLKAGAFFGPVTAGNVGSGAYMGMAAYVLKTGSVSTKSSSIMVPTTPGQAQALVPSYDVCIAERTSSGACGAPLSFTAGAYKFSLMGYTTGTTYALPAGVTHMGMRTKMTLVGTSADLTINGDKTLETIGSADVSSITITEKAGDRKQITITFPNKYNTGSTSSVANLMTPEATKTVKIKVSNVANSTQSIYVDYLFEALSQADKFFIYDPDAKETVYSASKAGHMSLSMVPLIALVAASMRF